jgi:PAS domain S-box-containing protein
LLTHAQLYTFREYNHKDGLKISTTLFTCQDSLGNLLIGTDGNGLVKYDGNAFSDVTPKGFNHPLHVTGYVKVGKVAFLSTLYSGIIKYSSVDLSNIPFPKFEKYGMFYSVNVVKKTLVCTTSEGILRLDLNGKVLQYIPFINGEVFIQRLQTPAGLLLFTSKSDYLVTNLSIQKLDNWLGTGTIDFQFGSLQGNILSCYDLSKQFRIDFDLKDSLKPKQLKSVGLKGSKIDISSLNRVDAAGNKAILGAGKNDLFELINRTYIKPIHNNTYKDIGFILNVFIDRSGDYWINTMYGVTKVSKEPFTKIQLNPFFDDFNILTSYLSSKDEVLFSNSAPEFNYANLRTKESKLLCNKLISDIFDCPLGTIVCAEDGVYKFHDKQLVELPILPEKTRYLFGLWENGHLWLATKEKGLLRYSVKTKKTELIISPKAYNVIYCGEVSSDNRSIFFGSNNGIYQIDTQTLKVKKVTELAHLGYFSGNSTKDSHGTIWFTLDKGLAGITKDGQNITIDNKTLPSILLYTLTSDQLGNLIVGTNLGIHIIKVDASGKVVRLKTYSYDNGFQGFETNMRSAYQRGNTTVVGTTQGLYIINSELIESYPTPPIPIVKRGRYLGQEKKYVDDNQFLTFETILPKMNQAVYYYKISGIDKQWIELKGTNELKLPEIENGVYSIQVKSTYNGISFSAINDYEVNIDNPIWKSKWFILFVILFVAILNFGYIEWSKNDTRTNYYENNQNYIDYHFVPLLFVVGAIVNLLLGILTVYFIDRSLGGIEVYIVTSSILLIMRFFLFAFGRGKNDRVINIGFYTSTSALFLQFYYLMYVSNIHPYSLIAIILISGCIPFLIHSFKTILFFCSVQLLLAFTVLIFVKHPIYNEVLFVIAICTSASLTMLITYLRNNTLKKMYFINNILNKGSMMVLSFDQKGLINYCSQNVTSFFYINADQLIGKPLGVLNPLVATVEMREMSLELEFEDGKNFLIPMYDRDGQIIWIDWSCKYISNVARVILGQDVTDKIKLATNYESLVENAKDLIYMTDLETNFTFLNEMSCRVFGFRKENLLGKSSIFIVHPDYRETVKTFYENQFKNRIQNTYLEFPIKTKDGKVVWLGQNVSLIYEPGTKKRIAGFSALARDITEKQLNELLIEQQNKDINSSINSAKRLQLGLIPKQTEFANHFENYFIFFKPKDIVSGDFYWMHQIEGKLIIVVADSTGHGITGAFMSILGISLLNQIVKERKIADPAQILNELNLELQNMIQQHASMTIIEDLEALIVVYDENQVHFSSSGVLLIHSHADELDLYRRTKIDENEPNSKFKNITLNTADEDIIYLFTDGYQKQFGSLKHKKFSLKNLMDLLRKIRVESLPLQKKHIENTLSDWSIGHEQTDDIIFIGLKKYTKKNKE